LEDVTRKTRSGLNHERLSSIPLEVIVQLCRETSEAEFDNVLSGVFHEVFKGLITLGAKLYPLYFLENTHLGEVQGEPTKLVA
jgi:hypothetical protein